MADPVLDTLTAEQRDTATTFLVDVGFTAHDPDEDPLTVTVEWAQDIAGPWTPATAQAYDRQHTLEAGLHRPTVRRALEGYWKLNGVPADDSAWLRDLTEIAAPAYGPGLFDQSIALVGNNAQSLQRGFNDLQFDFSGTTDFIIQVWVKFNALAGEQTLIEKFDGTAGPGWSLTKLSTDALRFHYGGPPGTFIDSAVSLAVADAVFHHLVVRRRNMAVEMFLDGTSVAGPTSVAALPAPSVNPLLLGKRVAPNTFPLDGSMDEVAIWLRSMDETEIASLYNAGVGVELARMPTESPGLAGNYVWNAFADLSEGTFTDIFIRLTVDDGTTTDDGIVGPISVLTTVATQTSTTTRALARRALIDATPLDFLGNGLVIPFRRGSRDFVSGGGVDAIKSAVSQILGTRAAVSTLPGELPWRPDFGSKLWILRHRNIHSITETAEAYIRDALQWEPRVIVTTVEVEDVVVNEENRMQLRVRYRIIDENVDGNRVLLPEFEEVITLAA